MAKLTPKQQRFVEEYLVDLNATQAAIRAGYKERTAYSQGQRLLKNVEIQNAIQQAREKRTERTEVTQDMVIRQLAKIAFHDFRDVVEWEGNEIRIRDSSEVDGTIIQEIQESISEGGRNLKVKTNDRMRALDMLGRHLGMFVDKKEISGKLDFADLLTQAWGKDDGQSTD